MAKPIYVEKLVTFFTAGVLAVGALTLTALALSGYKVDGPSTVTPAEEEPEDFGV